MQLNWLDKAVSWMSPTTGLRRMRAKAVADLFLSYEGVRSTRMMGGWNPQGTAGNAENGPSLARLRDNARDLGRNNAYAKRALREWAKKLVGYGITPQADTGNDVLNERIDGELWPSFVARCCSDQRTNYYAEQKRIARAGFESGECLIRFWMRRPEDGLRVPMQIQVLESDYIDTGKTETLKDGYIIQGIEFDMIGRVRGYWLFGQHPGDVLSFSRRGMGSKFVSAEYITYYGELERPQDARTVTRFAPVMNKLRDVDEYATAEIFRKKTEACLAAVVTTTEGDSGPTLGGKMTDASGNTVEQMQPGMIAYTQPGQAINFMSPSSAGDYETHKKAELREVATGLDMPYTVLADDLSDVNYSSFRGGAVSFRETLEEHRFNWFIPQVLTPTWERFIDACILVGELPFGTPYGVKWNPPPFDLLDREAEAKADEKELAIGKITYPQLCGNQGLDPEKQIAEIEKWRPRLEAAGVSFGQKGGVNGNAQNTAPGA